MQGQMQDETKCVQATKLHSSGDLLLEARALT